MKKMKLTVLLSALIIICASVVANAAPTLDGYMGDDWEDNYAVYDGFVSGGSEYRINKIGLFVDQGILYWGLDTGYELNYREDYTTPGNIYINISQGGTDYDFGIRWSVDDIQGLNYGISGTLYNADIDLYKNPNWTSVKELEQDDDGHLVYGDVDVPLKMIAGTGTLLEDDGITTYMRYGGTNIDPNSNTLEGAISLNLLTSELATLNETMDYDISISWTMSCGNDALGYSFTVPGTGIPGSGSAVPEPATFLLFGMGLLGIGALGRKKANKI